MIDKRIIGTWRLKRTKAVDDSGKALEPPRRLYAGVMQHQELFWERVAQP